MKHVFKIISLGLLLCASLPTFAAKNPISWTLDKTFQVPMHIGRSSTITYRLTNQLPFTLAKALVITKNAAPANAFTYVDNCTGVKLASRASCTVKVTLAPTTPR